MKADRVMVMDSGQIVESGPPARLLADPGSRFAALARAQLIASPDPYLPTAHPAVGRHVRAAGPGPVPAGPHARYTGPS
jgi:hypothetical protein